MAAKSGAHIEEVELLFGFSRGTFDSIRLPCRKFWLIWSNFCYANQEIGR